MKPTVITMTRACAADLTKQINSASEDLAGMLKRAHDEKAWQALGYSDWKSYVKAEIRFSEQHSFRLLDFANISKEIMNSPIGESLPLPTSESVTRPLKSVPTADRPAVYAAAVEAAGGKQPTAKQVEAAVIEITKPHVANNSGENEWYTPKGFIDSARSVMGGIDLDPASCDLANQTVKAAQFFTKEDDGLSKKWKGRVWLNPPYAQPLINQFSDAVSDKFDSGEIKQACVLVNNATETGWFQRMLKSASALCLIRSRVKFLDPSGKPGAPLQGQALIYFGGEKNLFAKLMKDHGKVAFL